MPKTLTVSTGPFRDLAFPAHESAEDFDREANEAGACVEEADASLAYRSHLPKFHKTFTPTMEQLTSVKRDINKEATEKARKRAKDGSKVDDIPESFITYANRVKASLSEADFKAVETAARELALTMPLDASPSARVAGPGKDLLSKADSLLTLPQDQLQTKIDKYLAVCEGFELETDEATGKPERASLARLVGKFLDYMLAQE